MIKLMMFLLIIIVFPVWGVPSTHFNSLSLEIIRIAQDLSLLVQRHEFKRDFARDAQGNILDTSKYIYTTPDGNIAKFLIPYQLFALAAKLEVVNRYFQLDISSSSLEKGLNPVRVRSYKNLSYVFSGQSEDFDPLQPLFENPYIKNFVISEIMNIISPLKIQIVSQKNYSILLGPDRGINSASRAIKDLFLKFVNLVFGTSAENVRMIKDILQKLSLDKDGSLEEIDFENLFIMTEILKGYFSPYLSPKEHLSFYDGKNHNPFKDYSLDTKEPSSEDLKLSNLLQFLFNNEFRFP